MDEVEGERAATEDAAGQQEAAGATRTEHTLEALRSGWGDGYRIGLNDGVWWYERLDAKGPGIPAAEAAVTSRTRSAPSLALGEPDQVRRLEQFRAAHPEVVILLRGALPKAWVGSWKIERSTLRGLLDELEEIFLSDAQASLALSQPLTAVR